MTIAPPAERTVVRLRSHARALVLPMAVLVGVCGGLGFATGRLTEEWQSIAVALAALVLVVVGTAMPFLAWLTRTYTITTRRTVVRSGILVRVRREVLHSRAVDVTVRRGALQTLAGSGDVLLGVDAAQPLILHDVPSPRLVADALHELIERSPRTGPDTRIG